MEIVEVNIDSLIPDPNNARVHGDENVKAIKGSMAKFGQHELIVIDDKNIVLSGNARLDVAKNLGWKTIKCLKTHLTSETDKMGLRLAMNRAGELAAWDDDILGGQLQALYEDDFDIESIGFDMDALTLDEPTEGKIDDDEIPEVKENIHNVKLGDIYQLGEHRLMCGDSTCKDTVDKLMNGELAVLMNTDPPYGVKLDQSWRDKALGDKALGAGNAKTVVNDDRADWLETYSNFEGDVCYVWHATSFTEVVKSNLEEAGFDVRQMIIWNKSVMVMGRAAYHWKHEPCWYAVRKGKKANWKGGHKQTTVWEAASPNHIMSGSKDDKTEHPTQKPLSLCETAILNHTVKSDGVYDPFLGSGSTLIACEKTNRKCYGMEIDPHYCSVIIERWQQFTGKEAEKIND